MPSQHGDKHAHHQWPSGPHQVVAWNASGVHSALRTCGPMRAKADVVRPLCATPVDSLGSRRATKRLRAFRARSIPADQHRDGIAWRLPRLSPGWASTRPGAPDPSPIGRGRLRGPYRGAACETAPVFEVPAVVRNKARAVGASDWLDELPALVAGVAAEWSIAVGRPYEGGTEAFVAEATGTDGTPAVLKVLMPGARKDASNEATVLRLAGGDGCPSLYRYDPDRGALLMERLGRPMHALGLPLSRRLEILCATAQRVWRPAPDCGLPSGADKARWLANFIVGTWEELDQPCSERAVDQALACAQRRTRAHRDDRSVLVHGDVHQLNALESGDGFKLVDPDGLVAEPEYDLGVLMRGDPVELVAGDPRDRAYWLAARTGLDPIAIWEWGVVERLSTGLLCTRINLQPLGQETLRAAEVVTGLPIG